MPPPDRAAPTDLDLDRAATRRAFLDARRLSSRERYDARISPGYDRDWGAIGSLHARCLDRLLDRTRPGGLILDAACGTGKYWPRILAAGRTVVGVDQSAGMLEVARAKHPEVPSGRLALQDLPFEGTYDAVICVDALENVGPEDWPAVTRALAAAARPGAPVYVTVERSDPSRVEQAYQDARSAGHPVVPGEDFDGVGYHYYPPHLDVLRWLDGAGLILVEEAEDDDYWHLLLRRAMRAR